MSATKPFVFSVIILFLSGCASGIKFPVSTVTPAADISGTMKQDKNKNYVIELTVEHMASADRLSPPKVNYIVWIVTESNGTKNIGKLDVKNGKKTSFITSTPFVVKEIFITAEDRSDISYPAGVEITRTRF